MYNSSHQIPKDFESSYGYFLLWISEIMHFLILGLRKKSI